MNKETAHVYMDLKVSPFIMALTIIGWYLFDHYCGQGWWAIVSWFILWLGVRINIVTKMLSETAIKGKEINDDGKFSRPYSLKARYFWGGIVYTYMYAMAAILLVTNYLRLPDNWFEDIGRPNQWPVLVFIATSLLGHLITGSGRTFRMTIKDKKVK